MTSSSASLLTEDLDAVAARVRDELARRTFTVFPGIPLEPAEAVWPDADLGRFLDTAEQLGVGLLYATSADGTRGPGSDVPSVAVAWAHDGLLHVWRAERPLRAPQQRPDRADVATLLSDSRFVRAANRHDRLRLASQLLPVLDDWSRVLVVREAEAVERLERRPARERAIWRQATELLDAGVPKSETARRCGVSTAVLERIMQTLP